MTAAVMSKQPEAFGLLLHRIRSTAKFSAREVADRAGVSLAAYEKWEEGIEVPTAQQFKRMVSMIPRLREAEQLMKEARTRAGLAAADKTLLDPSPATPKHRKSTDPFDKEVEMPKPQLVSVPTPQPPPGSEDLLGLPAPPTPNSFKDLATKYAESMLSERRAKARITFLKKALEEAQVAYELLIDQNVQFQEQLSVEADRITEACSDGEALP